MSSEFTVPKVTKGVCVYVHVCQFHKRTINRKQYFQGVLYKEIFVGQNFSPMLAQVSLPSVVLFKHFFEKILNYNESGEKYIMKSRKTKSHHHGK